MDWGLISVPLATLFFIISVVLTLRLRKRKEPVYAHKTTKIIGLGTDAPPQLKLTFNRRPVREVYRTIFIVFNRGREAIREGDLAENISVEFVGAKILSEPEVKKRSKEANRLSAKRVGKQGQDLIEVEFQYLNHKDGAVVEILHTGAAQINCTGDMIDGKDIIYIGEFREPLRKRSKVLALTFSVISAAIILVLISGGFDMSAHLREGWPSIGFIVFLSLPFVLAFLFATLLPYVPRYFRSRKFPDWTRGVLTDEASKLAEKGFPTEAYCFRCRTKRTIKHPQYVTLKNGRPAVRGVCPDCGNKIFRIGLAEEL